MCFRETPSHPVCGKGYAQLPSIPEAASEPNTCPSSSTRRSFKGKGEEGTHAPFLLASYTDDHLPARRLRDATVSAGLSRYSEKARRDDARLIDGFDGGKKGRETLYT